MSRPLECFICKEVIKPRLSETVEPYFSLDFKNTKDATYRRTLLNFHVNCFAADSGYDTALLEKLQMLRRK